jgi:hypothetical protein
MFDMTADFRKLFTWNTKLIFLFVTAEYKTELNQVQPPLALRTSRDWSPPLIAPAPSLDQVNQVVIWDYIIENVEHSELTGTHPAQHGIAGRAHAY